MEKTFLNCYVYYYNAIYNVIIVSHCFVTFYFINIFRVRYKLFTQFHKYIHFFIYYFTYQHVA